MAVSLLLPSSQHPCCPSSCLGLFNAGVTSMSPPRYRRHTDGRAQPSEPESILCSAELGGGLVSDICSLPTRPVLCGEERCLSRLIISALNMSRHRLSKSKRGLERWSMAPPPSPASDSHPLSNAPLPRRRHTHTHTLTRLLGATGETLGYEIR